MPSIEIKFAVFKPGQGFSEQNFRRAFVIDNKNNNEKITNADFKNIIENIKILCKNYNDGERGNSWNWSPVRIKDDNKKTK